MHCLGSSVLWTLASVGGPCLCRCTTKAGPWPEGLVIGPEGTIFGLLDLLLVASFVGNNA